MPKQTENGITVWTAGDSFTPMEQIEQVAKTANVVVPVFSAVERNALTKRDGLTVTRLDRAGAIEIWNGLEWVNDRGAPVNMWRMLEGDGTELNGIPAGEWRTITNWATVAGTPEPAEAGITYSGGVITIPKSGLWQMSAAAAMGNHSDLDGARMHLRINATGISNATSRSLINPYITVSVSKLFLISAGQTVQIDVQHNSGIQKGLHSDPTSQWWTMEYLGPR